jgi:hypothetical protein
MGSEVEERRSFRYRPIVHQAGHIIQWRDLDDKFKPVIAILNLTPGAILA